MIKGIHHLALAVADVAGAARFYQGAAALAEHDMGTLALPQPLGPARMLRGANCALRLLQAPQRPQRPQGPHLLRPVSEAGITHFCLQSEQVHGLHRHFRDAGASFHSDPIDLGTGYLYCYARDLEANVIELEGVAPLQGDPAPWFAHVAISTSRLAAMTAFYEAVLGSTAARSPLFSNNRRLDRIAGLDQVALEAAWIRSSNIQVELMQYHNPPTLAAAAQEDAPGYRYIALEVDHPGDELDRLCALGASLPPGLACWRTPQRAFCADPDGNLLLLMSLNEDQAQHAIAALPDPHIVARLAELSAAERKKVPA